jgi:hypothetical protein
MKERALNDAKEIFDYFYKRLSGKFRVNISSEILSICIENLTSINQYMSANLRQTDTLVIDNILDKKSSASDYRDENLFDSWAH